MSAEHIFHNKKIGSKMHDGIYLNNAGTSYPKPQASLDALSRAAQWSPRESWSDIEAVTNSFKDFLNIPKSHRMFFTNSCTSGINILLNSMAWAPGDVILSSGMEHYACSGVIDSLVQNIGIIHKVVPYHSDHIFSLDECERLLSEHKVKLIICCHGSNLTGDVFPLGKISDLAHAHGAMVLGDFAQTAGVIPIDVSELGVDLCAFTGHKGLLGPLGTGLISMDKSVKLARSPATCDFNTGACETELSFCDVGSLNTAGVASLGASLIWLQENHPKGTGSYTFRAFHLLVEELKKLPLKLYYARDGESSLPIASFVPTKGSCEDLAKQLFAQGVHVGYGQLCAPLAHRSLGTLDTGVLRISPSVFNTEDDIKGFIGHLQKML